MMQAGGAMLYKEMTQQAAQRDGDALGPRDISEPAMYAAQVLLQDATGGASTLTCSCTRPLSFSQTCMKEAQCCCFVDASGAVEKAMTVISEGDAQCL